MSLRRVGSSEHEDVGIIDFLFLVSQFEEFGVDFIYPLVVIDIHTEHMQPIFECSPSRACSQHNSIVVETDVFGVDDLICLHILQHTVLMDTTGVGESIAPHNRLIGLHRHVHQSRDHTADGVYFGGVDISVYIKAFVTFQDHGDFLQRGVSRPLTNAIDGHFHLSCSIDHPTEGIGCGQS